jgi:hypothetical protein
MEPVFEVHPFLSIKPLCPKDGDAGDGLILL